MHETLEEIMWPNRYLLRVLGVWPLSTNTLRARYFNYFCIVMGLIVITCMSYPVVYSVSTVYWGDLDFLANNGNIALLYILGGMKVIYMVIRHRACKQIHTHLTSMWNVSKEPEERAVFEPLAYKAQFITIANYGYAVMCIIAYFTSPLFNEYILHRNNSLMLPLPIEYGFEYHNRPWIFASLYLFQGSGALVSCIAVYVLDCTFMSVILHLSGQFKLVNFRLQTLGRKISDGTLGINDSKLREELAQCIAYHQTTLSITDDVNDVLEPLAFGHVAAAGLQLCLSGFLMVTRNPLELDILKVDMLFLIILAQLLIWCWPGELIIEKSGAIANTVYYDIPWWKMSPSLQRDLSLIVLRAQRECKILGFYQIMSMRKMTEVFNTACSYMAVLRSMKN